MLNITLNNITVNPQRPDAPIKTFGSSDVPHGTNSVIYKAAKLLNQNHRAGIALPTFTAAEVEALVSAKLSEIVVLPLKDEDGNDINYMLQPPSPLSVMEPTSDEVEAEFYVDSKAETKVAKKAQMSPMQMTPANLYVDLAAAKTALTNSRKLSVAKSLVDQDIDQCLIVPTLSDAFKAQFTQVQVEAL